MVVGVDYKFFPTDLNTFGSSLIHEILACVRRKN